MEALTVLFKRHSPLVFGISRRVLRNDAEAEDAVQQIFLDVFRSIHQFNPEKGNFKTWLLMFAYHRTFNCRRSQIANKFFETDPLEEGLSDSQRPGRGRSATENSLLVGQVLRSLQPRQRRTIELVYYEGLTAEEVSVRTGESVRVVRHNLYRGLEKLRKAFGAAGNYPRQKEVRKLIRDHKFYEMQCALAATGHLSEAEVAELERHVIAMCLMPDLPVGDGCDQSRKYSLRRISLRTLISQAACSKDLFKEQSLRAYL